MDLRAHRIIAARARKKAWPDSMLEPSGSAHPDFDESFVRDREERDRAGAPHRWGDTNPAPQDRLHVTQCGMLVCGHPPHGDRCEHCLPRYARHQMRYYPGDVRRDGT